jgi:hypothetical protein
MINSRVSWFHDPLTSNTMATPTKKKKKKFVFLLLPGIAFLLIASSSAFALSSMASSSSSLAAAATSMISKNSAGGPSSFDASHFLPQSIRPDLTKAKCDDCAAGYGVENSSGGLTRVHARVKVPSLTCTSQTAVSFFMVGIDGESSSDFAWASVYGYCQSGSPGYHAEWGDYNSGTSGTASWNPKAGDIVSLSVRESKNGNFVFTIKDGTNVFTGTGSDAGATNSYATCFTDMQSGYPAVDFGTVHFHGCKVNGTPVGSAPGTLIEWICYNSSGTQVLAKPTALSASGASFGVRFRNAGP